MTTPHTPPARPLDAERARLRSAGLSDDEISRIFVARELGAQPQQAGAGAPAGTAGQGVMSGVLNNMNAVMAHLRGVIPAIANQIVTLRDSSASASARITAGLSLTVKAALVVLFGYVVLLEFSQLRSSTEIARQQVGKATAESQAARHVPCLLEGTTACDELDKNILASKTEAEARTWVCDGDDAYRKQRYGNKYGCPPP
jgi:hypothetical protein